MTGATNETAMAERARVCRTATYRYDILQTMDPEGKRHELRAEDPETAIKFELSLLEQFFSMIAEDLCKELSAIIARKPLLPVLMLMPSDISDRLGPLDFLRDQEREIAKYFAVDARHLADKPKACAWCAAPEVVTNLDSDDLCQACANKWCQGEGQAAAEREI